MPVISESPHHALVTRAPRNDSLGPLSAVVVLGKQISCEQQVKYLLSCGEGSPVLATNEVLLV